MIGALLALFLGNITKLKYFRISAVVIGIASYISYFGLWPEVFHIYSLPAIICIFTGMVTRGGRARPGMDLLAWFGLFLVVLSLPLSFSSSYTLISTGELGSGVGYAVTGLAATIALVLVFIGGIAAKPKYLWLGAVTVGLLYIISFYGYYIEPTLEWWKILVALLSGILLLVEGVLLKVLRLRKIKAPV